ncbi:Uncharacterized membrane protein YgaE, UPF0421/DUF939 family [Saccharopolyspora kobensis]|uniref:Uncharacterized membrane protein YgaE, UPF0421/DUF939 family n=1 Tax=Saccharopolyspora kobensis TaxID=146035 RepID=A0A1H5VKJ0_9PSEU|nr:FUSC family protein [Saccharopolyspora kobensis]SEF87875.1 Uncharacterized membrane protein YgaE, UPF0421/DUF939 family [Saccharopolyspora kobensis]SFC59781.1 Uncharacterized membrane protein YgaE, UPF0421/DUF939 family [Saccharopolyspora kobensis]
MVGSVLRAVGRRVRHTTVRVLLAAVTAGVAWWLAQLLLGQPAPIFAPIAAVVSLIDEPGARGRRAFRMLSGVLVGVAVGEVLVRHTGAGPVEIGVATAVAMFLASAFSTNPLPILQAGIAALLVVGVHTPESGFSRLFGALIGGALALLVSQVLVTPSPMAMLSDAARTVLTPAARALRGAARALADSDLDAAEDTANIVREAHKDVAAFDAARSATREIALRTLRGRRERRRARQLDLRLSGLDSLHASVVLIVRLTQEVLRQHDEVPSWTSRSIAELAEAVEILAESPASAEHRRRAHDLAERLARLETTGLSHPVAALVTEVRLAAADLVELTATGEQAT